MIRYTSRLVLVMYVCVYEWVWMCLCIFVCVSMFVFQFQQQGLTKLLCLYNGSLSKSSNYININKASDTFSRYLLANILIQGPSQITILLIWFLNKSESIFVRHHLLQSLFEILLWAQKNMPHKHIFFFFTPVTK